MGLLVTALKEETYFSTKTEIKVCENAPFGEFDFLLLCENIAFVPTCFCSFLEEIEDTKKTF